MLDWDRDKLIRQGVLSLLQQPEAQSAIRAWLSARFPDPTTAPDPQDDDVIQPMVDTLIKSALGQEGAAGEAVPDELRSLVQQLGISAEPQPTPPRRTLVNGVEQSIRKPHAPVGDAVPRTPSPNLRARTAAAATGQQQQTMPRRVSEQAHQSETKRSDGDGDDDDDATKHVRDLHVRVHAGFGFADADIASYDVALCRMRLHAWLGTARAVSEPCAASASPLFAASMRLALPDNIADAPDLLHFAVVAYTEDRRESTLVGLGSCDWRLTLSTANDQLMHVQLQGDASPMHGVTAGVLAVRVCASSQLRAALTTTAVRPAVVDTHTGQRARRFLAYARTWWNEYVAVRATHAARLVTVLATGQDGVRRAATTYVQPFTGMMRLLDSPRHAARFVSLLPLVPGQAIGGGRSDLWRTPFAVLVGRGGDVEDHALLLCSLLLGFSLDAYVCIGTSDAGVGYAWVMTRSPYAPEQAVFWDAVTGDRYTHQPGKPARYPYRTLDCVFSNTAFYANVQATTDVTACSLALDNPTAWKAMDPAMLALAAASAPMQQPPPLLASNCLMASVVEQRMEAGLQRNVAQHRRQVGVAVDTLWSDELGSLLTPALFAYEMQRLTGATIGNEEFQQSIHRAIPPHHTFRGFPIEFTHSNADVAFARMLAAPACADILNMRGDACRYAVRVKVYMYPEDVFAVWVMLAVRYRPP